LAGPAVAVDVALVPAQAHAWRNTVCVVIDELRASSTITTLLDLGCGEILVTSRLADARQLARTHPGLLVGERHGVRPLGFDLNNSPAELRRATVRGQSVVLCTTNGTRVLLSVRHQPAVLVGCLLNACASAQAAATLAGVLDLNVGIVCAGQDGQFALDDAVAAGAIATRLVQRLRTLGRPVRLSDAARAALRLRAGYRNPATALRQSSSGRLVLGLRSAADIEICSRVDSSTSVALLQPGSPMRLVPWVPPGPTTP
jgi:2-phosphosulfolactate phosphatase